MYYCAFFFEDVLFLNFFSEMLPALLQDQGAADKSKSSLLQALRGSGPNVLHLLLGWVPQKDLVTVGGPIIAAI